MNIIGLDLAGKPQNPSGICFFQDERVQCRIIYSNEQILKAIEECKPEIIAIDAPLMKGKPRMRKADRELKKYGAFPPSLPSMKLLTIRGSKLVAQLEKSWNVIEVFPTATAKILEVYHKEYKKTAENLQVKVKNKHELDAYLCSLTAKLFLQGKTRAVGNRAGKIIVPTNQVKNL